MPFAFLHCPSHFQDDERDLDFSPGAQKRTRRNTRKGSAGSVVPLSTSLPASWMHCSAPGKGAEMKVRLGGRLEDTTLTHMANPDMASSLGSPDSTASTESPQQQAGIAPAPYVSGVHGSPQSMDQDLES